MGEHGHKACMAAKLPFCRVPAEVLETQRSCVCVCVCVCVCWGGGQPSGRAGGARARTDWAVVTGVERKSIPGEEERLGPQRDRNGLSRSEGREWV